jgi:hypothetical protein
MDLRVCRVGDFCCFYVQYSKHPIKDQDVEHFRVKKTFTQTLPSTRFEIELGGEL